MPTKQRAQQIELRLKKEGEVGVKTTLSIIQGVKLDDHFATAVKIVFIMSHYLISFLWETLDVDLTVWH